MTTWVISIDLAADGPLGEQHDMALASVQPYLESLPRRVAGRAGNVLASELLSSTGIRETNRYLLLVDVDKPSPRSLRMLADELTTVLPAGTNVSTLGEFDSVARAYRLKFIDNSKGQVIWVDVDGRTGRIMRISK